VAAGFANLQGGPAHLGVEAALAVLIQSSCPACDKQCPQHRIDRSQEWKTLPHRLAPEIETGKGGNHDKKVNFRLGKGQIIEPRFESRKRLRFATGRLNAVRIGSLATLECLQALRNQAR
jgi:hypothetical protein